MLTAQEARERLNSCEIEEKDKNKIEQDILRACDSGLNQITFYSKDWGYACKVAKFMEDKFYIASVIIDKGDQFYPTTYRVIISW